MTAATWFASITVLMQDNSTLLETVTTISGTKCSSGFYESQEPYAHTAPVSSCQPSVFTGIGFSDPWAVLSPGISIQNHTYVEKNGGCPHHTTPDSSIPRSVYSWIKHCRLSIAWPGKKRIQFSHNFAVYMLNVLSWNAGCLGAVELGHFPGCSSSFSWSQGKCVGAPRTRTGCMSRLPTYKHLFGKW